MPITFQLIATATTPGTDQRNFNSIPQTYDDLYLRAVSSSPGPSSSNGRLYLNNVTTGNNFSYLKQEITFSTSYSGISQSQQTSSAFMDLTLAAQWSSVANVFGTFELYIPNYTVTAQKTAMHFWTAGASDATNIQQGMMASTILYTPAITSLFITAPNQSFTSNSVMYLYGIKRN